VATFLSIALLMHVYLEEEYSLVVCIYYYEGTRLIVHSCVTLTFAIY